MRILIKWVLGALMLIQYTAAFSLSNAATVSYEVDERATTQAPWKVEEVVYEEALFYRKFLGVTSEGYYLVQLFYVEGGQQASAPYLLMEKEAVLSSPRKGMEQMHGKFIGFYQTGGKKEEFDFEEGRLHGLMVGWHENGQKAAEYHFVDGQRHGLCTEWYENGAKKWEANYQNGYVQGVLTQWDESGRKTAELHYDKDGEVVKTVEF